MADTPLDKLVDEYLQELAAVLAAWDCYWQGAFNGWFPSDGKVETETFDAAVSRFVPFSEQVEKSASARGLNSSTAPLTILRSRLILRSGIGPELRQSAIEAAELIRIESMHGRAVAKKTKKAKKKAGESITERMKALLAENFNENAPLTSRQWGKKLKCSHSAVADTELFKSPALEAARMEASSRRHTLRHVARSDGNFGPIVRPVDVRRASGEE